MVVLGIIFHTAWWTESLLSSRPLTLPSPLERWTGKQQCSPREGTYSLHSLPWPWYFSFSSCISVCQCLPSASYQDLQYSWRRQEIYVFDKEIVRFDSHCRNHPLAHSSPSPWFPRINPPPAPLGEKRAFFQIQMFLYSYGFLFALLFWVQHWGRKGDCSGISCPD